MVGLRPCALTCSSSAITLSSRSVDRDRAPGGALLHQTYQGLAGRGVAARPAADQEGDRRRRGGAADLPEMQRGYPEGGTIGQALRLAPDQRDAPLAGPYGVAV